MIATPERSPERDEAIAAMLPAVPFTGWTIRTLLDAAGPDADLLFPGGPLDMVETYVDRADRLMADAAAAENMALLRVPDRVRRVIALRLEQSRPNRDAVARALGLLALPQHAVAAARTAARTVDAIWQAAGDRSADWSWYTKRAILTPVYGTTLLFWLRDGSEDDEATLAFLDRRLAAVARLGRWRRRFGRAAPPPNVAPAAEI